MLKLSEIKAKSILQPFRPSDLKSFIDLPELKKIEIPTAPIKIGLHRSLIKTTDIEPEDISFSQILREYNPIEEKDFLKRVISSGTILNHMRNPETPIDERNQLLRSILLSSLRFMDSKQNRIDDQNAVNYAVRINRAQIKDDYNGADAGLSFGAMPYIKSSTYLGCMTHELEHLDLFSTENKNLLPPFYAMSTSAIQEFVCDLSAYVMYCDLADGNKANIDSWINNYVSDIKQRGDFDYAKKYKYAFEGHHLGRTTLNHFVNELRRNNLELDKYLPILYKCCKEVIKEYRQHGIPFESPFADFISDISKKFNEKALFDKLTIVHFPMPRLLKESDFREMKQIYDDMLKAETNTNQRSYIQSLSMDSLVPVPQFALLKRVS